MWHQIARARIYYICRGRVRCPLFLHFSHLLVEVVMVLLPSTLQAWGHGCVSSVLSLHMALAFIPSTEKGVGALGTVPQAQPRRGTKNTVLHGSWAGTSQVESVLPASPISRLAHAQHKALAQKSLKFPPLRG